MRPDSRSLLLLTGVAAALLVSAAGPALAQTDSKLHTIPVQGQIYMIVGPNANAAVQVGDQGVLVVDTLAEPLADDLLAEIRKLSDKPIRYIINTSFLPEHTGGNEKLRKAGITIMGANVTRDIQDAATGAKLIAPEAVLDRMSATVGSSTLRPSGAWPTDTFVTPRHTLFFNGEPIEILHIPASTTDGSSLVWFRKSDVIIAGEIYDTERYPIIDLTAGGRINGVVDGLNRMLEITVPMHEEEGGTLIVPGHGRICDEADLVTYRDMITVIRNRVQKWIARGMTLNQIKEARPTFDYDREYGRVSGNWTTDMFVDAVYRSLSTSR